MALYRRIKPDPETLAIELASAAFRETRSQATARPGSVYIPNGDGTATIIGPAAGHDGTGGMQGVAPWVGDTTPPGRPTGVTATSAWGIVYVTWAGTLEGGVPADFDHASVLVDGSEVAQMSRQGTVAVEGLPAGATVTVTLVAYDDAHARDGSPSPNASEPSEPLTVTVSDERAEIDKSVQEANDRADALQQEMTDVKATVNGVEQDVSELTTKVSGAVEKADQSLSVATEAKQTADSVSTTASRAYEDAQSALTQSSSALQTAQQLKTTVEEDYLSKDEATGTYASRSDVTQAKDQILSEVSTEYQSKDGMSSYYTKTEVDQKNDAITSTVSTAQSTADSALSKASTVEQTAEGLTVRLDSAEGDIGLAQAAASNAQSSADAAKTEAQTAQALANTAKTAAETAQGTATSALGTANRAQSVANSASSAASAAQDAADDAAKVATNFLGFSYEGLVVGDQTGASLGKNVLIDAESLSIRDGSTVLARFGDDAAELGANGEESTVSLMGGKGAIRYGDQWSNALRIHGVDNVVLTTGSSGIDGTSGLSNYINVSHGGGDGNSGRITLHSHTLAIQYTEFGPDNDKIGAFDIGDLIDFLSRFVNLRVATGSKVITGQGIQSLLFTSAELQTIMGSPFDETRGDVISVMNGDMQAYANAVEGAYYNPQTGNVGIRTSTDIRGLLRVNYAIFWKP